MGTLGPNAGSLFANDATVGTVDWSSTDNAYASDDAYATAVLSLTNVSHYLVVTGFRFAIPSDAIINGITVTVERSASGASALTDNSVRLTLAHAFTGSEKASGAVWPTSDAVQTYGSATDLWGGTWTPANLNDVQFGVGLAVGATLLGATAQVDQVLVTVDYTGSGAPGSGGRFVVGDGLACVDEAA